MHVPGRNAPRDMKRMSRAKFFVLFVTLLGQGLFCIHLITDHEEYDLNYAACLMLVLI